MLKRYFKKLFWPIFIVIFIATTAVVGINLFNYLTSPYKVQFRLPISFLSGSKTNAPVEISNDTRSGYINSDEAWSGEIQVVGDIVVAKGVKLTIKPGTTVLVAANSDTQNLMTLPFWQKDGLYLGEGLDQYIIQGEPYRDEPNHITIWIEGTLEAVGTPDKKIVIKSDSDSPGRYDWNTFHIENGEISYAEIRDYRALDLRTGTILTNSELHNVGECPICIHDSKNVLVERNWVHDSGHEVVDILNSSPAIRNNRFGPSPQFKNPGGYNAGWGGIIVGSGFPVIEDNIIEGFDDGVSFFNQKSYDALAEDVLKNNTIRNNTENIFLNLNPD